MNIKEFVAKYFKDAGLPEPEEKEVQRLRISKHMKRFKNGSFRATKAYADGRQKMHPKPRRRQH